jgi:deoxyribonuclease V
LSVADAIALQNELATRVELSDRYRPIRRVGGLDVSYNFGDDRFFAAAVVLSFPELQVLETVTAVARTPFPYVPGLLSFREIPALAEALAKLRAPVDLLACDGQGVAHPRRFGLAAHLGVLFDVPAVGIAKSRLIGEAHPPARERGTWTWLTDKGERIGQLVRTRAGVAPMFVSPGHRLSFHTARALALALCPKWRLPETTRLAHHTVNELRRSHGRKKTV